MPRIWFSRIFSTMTIVDYGIRGILKNMDYLKAYRNFIPYDEIKDQVEVKALTPRDEAVRIPKSDADAFMIGDGFIVTSPKLRDVLVQFDLGKTRLIPVAWLKWGGEPSDREPYYLFHVAEAKPTLIPEKSQNLKRQNGLEEDPITDQTLWRPIDLPDTLAVMASAAEGVDIWHDPLLQNRVFFSDRLRIAIEAADLRAKTFTLQEATVIG